MAYTKKLAAVSLVSLIACLSNEAILASGSKTASATTFQEFKLTPRVNFWGFSGDYTRGEGQVMFPILSNANHAFYFVAEGNKVVNDSDWLGGAGFGYRQICNNRIFGGYLIGDYQNSSENNGFYIANPGLEMLSDTWDIDVNGYLPFKQKKSYELQDVVASEDLGITNFVHFYGHNESDHIMQLFTGGHGKRFGEEAGRGFDGEIGRVIPHVDDLRVYLGGYHFDLDDADAVNGVEARAVYELNRYFALEGEYNYDNIKHSQAVVGLRFSLGGYSAEEHKHYGIATRLLYPIEHDLATGVSTAEIQSLQRITDLGEHPIHDNIQFFKPLALSTNKANDIGPKQGDGTFENPYIGFTPANVSGIPETIGPDPIDKHPLLYFAPGTYNFDGFTSRAIDQRFTLPTGWGMYGRMTNDYKTPAVGSARAIFIGGLDLAAGSAQTVIDSISIQNNKSNSDNAALYVVNVQDAILNNADIQNNAALANEESLVGIYANSSQLTLTNSSVLADCPQAVALPGLQIPPDSIIVAGIEMSNSTLNLNGNNSINSVANVSLSSASMYGLGIAANNSTINFNCTLADCDDAFGNKVNVSVTNDAVDGIAAGLGIADLVVIVGSRNTTIAPIGLNDKINFNSGVNTVSVAASAGSTAVGYGINVMGSGQDAVINFLGGTNSISVNTASTNVSSTSLGIGDAPIADYTRPGKGEINPPPVFPIVNFFGGTNSISVAATNSVGSSVSGGIVFGSPNLEGGIINIRPSTSEVTISSNTAGTQNYGILVSAPTPQLLIDGIAADVNTFASQVNFLTNTGGGFAIDFNGDTFPWPTP